jgi:hypothetical protein
MLNSIKNSKKITSLVLIFVTLGITYFGAKNLFVNDKLKNWSQTNSVNIQKIDDNRAILHCDSDSIKTEKRDFLFSKTKISNGFQYDVSNLGGSQKYYSYNTKTEINFDDGLPNNSKLCVAIWGAIVAPSAVATAGAIVTTAGAAISAAPVVGAIVGAGATSVATVGSFAAGAAIATSLAVAAAPLAIIGGAAVGLAGIG